MDKGDRFVVEIEYVEKCNFRVGKFALVGANDDAQFVYDSVRNAAAAYAAKPTPAGWTPKKGERVLVECKGTVIDVNPSIMPVSALIEFKHGNAEWFLATHILPDPVKPKFAVGQLVFSIKQQAVVEIDHYDSEKEIYFSAWQYGTRVSGKQDDFMSLDEAITPEAREKLEK